MTMTMTQEQIEKNKEWALAYINDPANYPMGGVLAPVTAARILEAVFITYEQARCAPVNDSGRAARAICSYAPSGAGIGCAFAVLCPPDLRIRLVEWEQEAKDQVYGTDALKALKAVTGLADYFAKFTPDLLRAVQRVHDRSYVEGSLKHRMAGVCELLSAM